MSAIDVHMLEVIYEWAAPRRINCGCRTAKMHICIYCIHSAQLTAKVSRNRVTPKTPRHLHPYPHPPPPPFGHRSLSSTDRKRKPHEKAITEKVITRTEKENCTAGGNAKAPLCIISLSRGNTVKMVYASTKNKSGAQTNTEIVVNVSQNVVSYCRMHSATWKHHYI